MLVVADKYEIIDVQQQLEEYLKLNIAKGNVINILTIADKLGLVDLKSKALEFIRIGNYDQLGDLNGYSDASIDIVRMIANELTKLRSFMSRKLG